MGRNVAVVAVLLLGFAGLATDLSGTWSTTIAIGEEIVPLTDLTLQFGFADWKLTTSFTWQGASLLGQELSLEASFGALGISAGAAFRVPEGAELELLDPGTFSLGDLQFLGGYISFELSLGDLTLKLTLVQGAPPRDR
jgi:hypothetical protein